MNNVDELIEKYNNLELISDNELSLLIEKYLNNTLSMTIVDTIGVALFSGIFISAILWAIAHRWHQLSMIKVSECLMLGQVAILFSLGPWAKGILDERTLLKSKIGNYLLEKEKQLEFAKDSQLKNA